MKKIIFQSVFSFFLISYPMAGFSQLITPKAQEEEAVVQEDAPALPEVDPLQEKIAEIEALAASKAWSDVQKKAPEALSLARMRKDKNKLNDYLREARYQLLLSKTETETSEWYEIKPGDALEKIAKKYNTTAALIQKANGLKSDMIRVGKKLKVEKVPFSIEVSIRQNSLVLKQGENEIKRYPVSTGSKGNTPEGTFKIVNKLVDPTWYHDGREIPPGDPENGLGTRWLGFDLKGYGIHGTIEPEKIGKPASLGCVRMRNEDVEEIFDFVPTGTEVVVRK